MIAALAVYGIVGAVIALWLWMLCAVGGASDERLEEIEATLWKQD